MRALRVDHVQRLRVERAGDRARAGELAREAHAFLVAEGHHLDREGQALAGAMQRRHGLDRGDHAEIAVVVAGVADRVDVRAEQQRRRSGPVALVAADHVGGGIELGRHAGLLHPAAHHARGGGMGRREVEAGELAGLAGAARELVQMRHHVGAEGGAHGSRSLSRRRAMRSTWASAVASSVSRSLLRRRWNAARISALLRPLTAMMNGKPNLRV